jgi:hypothetical protein
VGERALSVYDEGEVSQRSGRASGKAQRATTPRGEAVLACSGLTVNSVMPRRSDGETEGRTRFADAKLSQLVFGGLFANGRPSRRPLRLRRESWQQLVRHDPGGSRTSDLRIKRAYTNYSSSIIEHRYSMSRPLRRNQSSTDEIRPDSGRIFKLRVISRSQKGTLARLIVGPFRLSLR